MRLVSIPTGGVMASWPKVADLISASCRRSPDPVSPECLRDMCASGRARLLLAVRPDGSIAAAGVVAVGSAGGRVVCEILACAGSGMRDWLAGIDEVEAWARFHGAACLRFAGRPGWARMLPGYRLGDEALFSKDI